MFEGQCLGAVVPASQQEAQIMIPTLLCPPCLHSTHLTVLFHLKRTKSLLRTNFKQLQISGREEETYSDEEEAWLPSQQSQLILLKCLIALAAETFYCCWYILLPWLQFKFIPRRERNRHGGKWVLKKCRTSPPPVSRGRNAWHSSRAEDKQNTLLLLRIILFTQASYKIDVLKTKYKNTVHVNLQMTNRSNYRLTVCKGDFIFLHIMQERRRKELSSGNIILKPKR